jgi:hypothetical protein
VGGVAGAITGKLIVVAGRRPRLARWIALGLLVACASGPVRTILFDLVIFWGMLIRWVLKTWPITGEHVWATAVIFGAFTGAFVAWVAMQLARWHRSRHVSRTAGAGALGVARSRAREYVEG